MPKKNPKHYKKYRRTYNFEKKKRRFQIRRVHIIGLVFLGIFTAGVAALLIIGRNTLTEWKATHVEVGDTVTIWYKMWILTDDNGEPTTEEPYREEKPYTIVMRDTAEDTGIIYGLWKSLLGMRNGSIKVFALPKCVDDLKSPPDWHDPNAVAGDGWDDRYPPGQVRCESYGSGALRYTPLKFWVQVINLEKGEENTVQNSGEAAVGYSENISGIIFDKLGLAVPDLGTYPYISDVYAPFIKRKFL